MRCQFLREAQVRFCSASAYKKLILRTDDHPAERCTSSQWTTCPAAKQHREDHPATQHCPFLQESLVQYCSVASVSKFIPYTDASTARCNTESHRYCDVFLDLARSSDLHKDPSLRMVEGIRIPPSRTLTRNHWWIDHHADGLWHIGIDEFLTRALGRTDAIIFLTLKGNEQPSVLVKTGDLELNLMFPGRGLILGINSVLRAAPGQLVSDPYTHGWLFEGNGPRAMSPNAIVADPESWMVSEIKELHEYVQQREGGERLAADGGVPVNGLLGLLKKEQALHLFNRFFHPQRSERALQ